MLETFFNFDYLEDQEIKSENVVVTCATISVVEIRLQCTLNSRKGKDGRDHTCGTSRIRLLSFILL